MHATLRKWRIEVQVLAEHHFVKDSSVADIERHLSCKQVHVSANLTGGSISTFPT